MATHAGRYYYWFLKPYCVGVETVCILPFTDVSWLSDDGLKWAVYSHSRYSGSTSPPKIRLIDQSFSKLLFDILECHYSRTKEVLAIQQEQKYKRNRPETTSLYQLVERYYPEFTTNLAERGKYLPKYVEREFDEFLRYGRLEYGFLRVVCGDCKHEKLVAFSCKRHGFCNSCGARRMAESAALLVDDVLRGYPVRQWVLSLPIPLRLLLARYPSELSKVMQIIHRAISSRDA
nr:transposase zinc-binding domain-containing protein [Glaciecola nitratireducens]